ncbi:MAG: tail fiber domain-containing protein [Lachnospiraceae bacterium]
MSENTVKARLRHAVKPEATWTSDNPVLKEGEVGYVKETGRYKVGDGKTAWNSLAWAQPSSHTHDDRYIKLTGGTMTGALVIQGNAANKPLKVKGIVGSNGSSEDGELYLQYGVNQAVKLGSSGSYNISADGGTYSGKAARATKLATARTINGTSFDGSGNITTANWGTSRNITIGNTKKAVNGGGDVSWSLSEIGASATNHTHSTMNKEAYLEWGGKNFAGSYGPIDAAMIPDLGANRFAFLNKAGVKVEYSKDSGATWTTWKDYGTESGIFGAGFGYTIGNATSSNKATEKDMLRITIDSDKARIYTVLNKFAIYISAQGSAGNYCTIDASLESSPTVFKTFADKVPIKGWSGWNIINTDDITTYQNSATNQYGLIRFTFGCTGNTSNYSGLQIQRIMGFGGVGWDTPSNMARCGTIYSYDNDQNVTFPAQVSAALFKGNATTASAVKDSGDGSTTTFAYSKAGLNYNQYTWLAAWNGKELRAINKSQFAQASHIHTKSQITDFPTSLKNPTSLILRLNGGTTEGTNQFTYDGSTAKTISITPAGIGAATSGHNHDNTYLGKTATATAATKAAQDSAGQQINTTYIKSLSISGKTITYTKGDNTTGTITTQDTDTHYTTRLKVCASATGTAHAAATNGKMRINVLDNTTVRDSIIIQGTGATSVTSDASGVITINSASYSTGTTSTAGLTKLYTSTGTSTDGTMTRKAITDALSGKAPSNHNHDGDYVPLENGTVTVSSDMGAYIDLQDTNGGLGTHLQMSVKGASKWDLAANSSGELSLTYITNAGSNWLYAMNASRINMYQSVTVGPSPLATTANSMMVKVTTAGLQNFAGRTISLYASGSDNNYAGIYDHDNGWILYCDTDKVVHIPKELSTTSVTVSGNLQWRNSSGTAYVIAGTLSNDSYKNMTRIGNLTYETGIYTKTNVWKNGSTTTHFATTTTTSDQRLKEKISDMSVYEDFFCKLKPFAFKYHEGLYNANGTKPMIQWGYGAQDTVKAFKESGLDWQQEELVVIEDGELTEEEKKYTTDGKMFKMNYQNMSALNTHMIQKCLEEIAELKRQLVELKEG